MYGNLVKFLHTSKMAWEWMKAIIFQDGKVPSWSWCILEQMNVEFGIVGFGQSTMALRFNNDIESDAQD
jgi:hypothetical protein